MDEATREKHLEAVKRDGFTIVENALEPQLIDALNEALGHLERDLSASPAMNSFEGHHTVRIYNLLAHGAPFTEVPTHTSVLPIVDGGMTNSDALMQAQADILGIPVARHALREATACGAAICAARGVGLLGADEVAGFPTYDRTYEPRTSSEEAAGRFNAWKASAYG